MSLRCSSGSSGSHPILFFFTPKPYTHQFQHIQPLSSISPTLPTQSYFPLLPNPPALLKHLGPRTKSVVRLVDRPALTHWYAAGQAHRRTYSRRPAGPATRPQPAHTRMIASALTASGQLSLSSPPRLGPARSHSRQPARTYCESHRPGRTDADWQSRSRPRPARIHSRRPPAGRARTPT
jgi:hypothetical protein